MLNNMQDIPILNQMIQEINEYLIKNPLDVVPDLIRNKITIKINNMFSLEVENINKYNLQPCRLFFKINDMKNSKKWKGLIVDRKWANSSKISSILDVSNLSKPKKSKIT